MLNSENMSNNLINRNDCENNKVLSQFFLKAIIINNLHAQKTIY